MKQVGCDGRGMDWSRPVTQAAVAHERTLYVFHAIVATTSPGLMRPGKGGRQVLCSQVCSLNARRPEHSSEG